MSPSRLRVIHPVRSDQFWDIAMEQLIFWRRSGTCPHDCLGMLGREPSASRPLWDDVLHALLIEAARMQQFHVGPRRKAA
jgi:hypothetical protein